MGIDIPANRSFQSYQNANKFKNWRSCSFQSYQKPGRHYASRQLSELSYQNPVIRGSWHSCQP